MPSCPWPLVPQSRYLPSASRAPELANAATRDTTWAERAKAFHLERHRAGLDGAVAELSEAVEAARPDLASRVVERMVERAGDGGHVRERQPDRCEVLLVVTQAQLSALVIAPAPDVAFGIDGQGGVEGHHVNGQRGDLHPRREAHPHRLREGVRGRAVAQLARVAQPPRVDAAVGQQGVLAGVRRGHLRDRARQAQRRRGGSHVLGLECAGPPEERAPVPDGAGPGPSGAMAAGWTARDCATAGISWTASRRAIALRPAAAHLTIQRMLPCVLGVRFTGSPPRVLPPRSPRADLQQNTKRTTATTPSHGRPPAPLWGLWHTGPDRAGRANSETARAGRGLTIEVTVQLYSERGQCSPRVRLRTGRTALPRWRSPRPRWTW